MGAPGSPLPVFRSNFASNAIQLPEGVDPRLKNLLSNDDTPGQEEEFLSKEGMELWNKHFAPAATTDQVIQVPVDWCKFIIVALLTPANFEWAKALLVSQLWKFIIEGSDSQVTIPFVLPDKCPTDQMPICNHAEFEQEASSNNPVMTPPATDGEALPLQAVSTSVAHAQRKRKDKAPVVETEVRRSFRLQEINKGFKRQTCQDKNCFPCSSGPPAIANKIVKNLSVSFCKAAAKDCTDEMLHQSKKKKESKQAAKGPQKKAPVFKP